jgi:hypothetical protein
VWWWLPEEPQLDITSSNSVTDMGIQAQASGLSLVVGELCPSKSRAYLGSCLAWSQVLSLQCPFSRLWKDSGLSQSLWTVAVSFSPAKVLIPGKLPSGLTLAPHSPSKTLSKEPPRLAPFLWSLGINPCLCAGPHSCHQGSPGSGWA